MFILDEQITDTWLVTEIGHRHKPAHTVKELGWGGAADEDLPALLLRHRGCTLVTIDDDFWKRVDGNPGYCIVCFDLKTGQLALLPDLLRRLLLTEELRTKAGRCGKLVLVSGCATRRPTYRTRTRWSQPPGKPVAF